MDTPFIVGAYAAETAKRDDWYRALADQSWISGLELPVPGDLLGDQSWLLAHIPTHWDHMVVTDIPRTMQRLASVPDAGLASPSLQGRSQGMADVREVRDAVARLADSLGRQSVAWVELHSAPTGRADAQALADSLAEVAQWDWSGAALVIEHCDAYIDGQAPEKGFLDVSAEIQAVQCTGVGITVNWGRSAIEGRSGATVLRHVDDISRAHLLAGVMFSGAGAQETDLGPAWADLHLPMTEDLPGSLLDASAIADTLNAVHNGHQPAYVGAKIQALAHWNVDRRLAAVQRIYDTVEETWRSRP